MISEQLQKKIDRSIKLLQSVAKGYDGEIEVAYSGGKDSDVILQLAKEAGIRYRAIYKNTTIDPPGTIAHVIRGGGQIIRPEKSFFDLIAERGYPNRLHRFCCRYLKEYKILDKVIIGIRKCESIKRNKNYSEPTECRFYGNKKDHIEAIYPILDWSDDDVLEFINERKIKLHPLYYREDGSIDIKRRLGCMGCPLMSDKKRAQFFKDNPKWVRAWIKAGDKFRRLHPDSKTAHIYDSVYEWFCREVFFVYQRDFEIFGNSLFGKPDYKQLLEDYFGIDLTLK